MYDSGRAEILTLSQTEIRLYFMRLWDFLMHRQSKRKGEAHIVYFKYQKKYFNSSELVILSTTMNSNPRSVDTGAVGAVREEQKHAFEQNQDSGPCSSSKSSMITKTYI